MILYAFRTHLAKELEKIPPDAEQVFESYAVTTAALARRLLEYLEIDDLRVANGFGDDPPAYPLRTVLDRILHFRVLHQDAMTFAIPGEPDLVTLYSDRAQGYDDHLYIRLREYRDVLDRLASDDRYVARHLFRRSVTLMNNAMRQTSEPAEARADSRQAEFRKWVSGMVGNAWNLLVALVESGDLECPDVAVECYEACYVDGTEEYRRRFASVSIVRDLFPGHGPGWWWAPYTPSKVEICGREKYCMHLSAVNSETERTIRHLYVPFESFIGIFRHARCQLDGR